MCSILGAPLPNAAWQRCCTHYAANLMSITPKASWPLITTMLHSVYDQPDAASEHAHCCPLIEAIADGLLVVATRWESARPNTSLIRLVGAILSDQSHDSIEGRRHLGLDVLARSGITLITTKPIRTKVPNKRYLAGHQSHARTDHASNRQQHAPG